MKHPQHNLNPNEIKNLCANSNKIAQTPKENASSVQPVDGWTAIEWEHDKKSNFKGVAFKKGNEIVICYVGTDKNIKDHVANLKMPFRPTQQMKDADSFYQDILSRNSGCRISLAGHSEGGAEAQYVCVQNNGVPTYTYNSFMSGSLYDEETREAMKDHIVNFRHPDDMVSKMGKDIGHQYIVPSPTKNFIKSIGEPTYSHKIQSVGDCLQSIPIEDYKRKNKLFVGKLNETVITGKDIKEMDSETFDLLGNYLKENKDSNVMNTRTVEKLVNAGEMVHVKAYRRDDGTLVDEHYRKYPA